MAAHSSAGTTSSALPEITYSSKSSKYCEETTMDISPQNKVERYSLTIGCTHMQIKYICSSARPIGALRSKLQNPRLSTAMVGGIIVYPYSIALCCTHCIQPGSSQQNMSNSWDGHI